MNSKLNSWKMEVGAENDGPYGLEYPLNAFTLIGGFLSMSHLMFSALQYYCIVIARDLFKRN